MEMEEGDSVIIESPDFFHGKKVAIYLHPCKIHENGIECYLVDKTAPVKLVCVNPTIAGNSIALVSNLTDVVH